MSPENETKLRNATLSCIDLYRKVGCICAAPWIRAKISRMSEYEGLPASDGNATAIIEDTMITQFHTEANNAARFVDIDDPDATPRHWRYEIYSLSTVSG